MIFSDFFLLVIIGFIIYPTKKEMHTVKLTNFSERLPV